MTEQELKQLQKRIDDAIAQGKPWSEWKEDNSERFKWEAILFLRSVSMWRFRQLGKGRGKIADIGTLERDSSWRGFLLPLWLDEWDRRTMVRPALLSTPVQGRQMLLIGSQVTD